MQVCFDFKHTGLAKVGIFDCHSFKWGSVGKFNDDHFDLNNIFDGFSNSFPQGQNLTKFSICPENVLVSMCNNYHQSCLLHTINQMSHFGGFYLLFDDFFLQSHLHDTQL